MSVRGHIQDIKDLIGTVTNANALEVRIRKHASRALASLEEMEREGKLDAIAEKAGWMMDVRYWRECECACGYSAREYIEGTIVCTKCFNGRKVPDGTAMTEAIAKADAILGASGEDV